jgi:hypothetical protein
LRWRGLSETGLRNLQRRNVVDHDRRHDLHERWLDVDCHGRCAIVIRGHAVDDNRRRSVRNGRRHFDEWWRELDPNRWQCHDRERWHGIFRWR